MDQDFGALVRSARLRTGITQSALAQTIGIDHSYISKVERGMIPPPIRPKVIAWIDTLGITDPQERMQYLLAAGCLSYEDVEKAATAVDLENRPEAQELYTILNSFKSTAREPRESPDQALIEILNESVGPEIAGQLVSLVELMSNSQLDENTKKGVWENLLTHSITLMKVLSPPNGETTTVKKGQTSQPATQKKDALSKKRRT